MGQNSKPTIGLRVLRFTSNLLLSTIVFCLVVLATEFLASFWGEPFGKQFRSHETLHHVWPASSKWVHDEWIATNPDFPTPYTHHYNSQGWIENYNIKKQKPKNTYRIFYVGDSFIEGTLPMKDSIPSVVEQFLNTHSNTKTKFEVINTGTASYSPLIYYVLIRNYIQEYQPDAIVLNVDMTDIFDDWKYRPGVKWDEEGNPLAVSSTPPYKTNVIDGPNGAYQSNLFTRVNLFLYTHSSLYRFTFGSTLFPWLTANSPLVLSRKTWMQEPWSETTERNVKNSFELLTKIFDYCRANNIRLLVSSSPWYHQFPHKKFLDDKNKAKNQLSARPHYELETLCRKNGIGFLNSFRELESFVTNTDESKYYYRGNMHLNPRGYKLWANAHIKALLKPENKMLPKFALDNENSVSSSSN